MIDTLMVMWNRGHGGRSILVSLAFFLICISVSLLLVSLGAPFFSQLRQDPRGNSKSIVSAAKFTPTPQSTGAEPAADNTVTINAPTATATPTICYTPVVTRTSSQRGNSTIYRGTSHHKPHPKPTHPRPTPTPQPTTTPRPTPTPGMTPTLTPIPTVTSTPTPTPTVVPTRTPIPTVTPTPTPTVVPTRTLTPIATLEVTATFPARTGVIVHAKNFSRLGGGGNPVSTGTTSSGQSGNIWNTGCLHAGDSLDLNAGDVIMAAVERSLWLIIGGSTLGTLLFYGVAYLLVRNRTR